MAAFPKLFTTLLIISIASARPSKNIALDKATANDVVINSVSAEQKILSPNPEELKPIETEKIEANIEVEHTPVTFSTHTTTLPKPGFAVARIIDDIFQIPIGVLQSVSRLLRNPFVSHNKTPETASSY